MKNKTFEEYLQDKFSEEYPELLDDDGEDRFVAWLERLDTAEVIVYAEQAVKELNESYDRISELAKKLEELNEQAVMELQRIESMAKGQSEKEAYQLAH